MKIISIIIILLFLLNQRSSAQRQADLTKFVKIPDAASGVIEDIDSVSSVLERKFVEKANDSGSVTHQEIQSFFRDYKQDGQNVENNNYPETITQTDLGIQFIDYASNYGWVGHAADSVFNTSRLTALIVIPAFDNLRKGQVVNTISFKMTVTLYTESDLNTHKIYKRQERVLELKQLSL